MFGAVYVFFFLRFTLTLSELQTMIKTVPEAWRLEVVQVFNKTFYFHVYYFFNLFL